MRRRAWDMTAVALIGRFLNAASLYKKNQKEEGSARALPLTAPMPKSVSF